MSEWYETLPGLLSQAQQRLSRGVADRHAPARHPTLATTSVDGWPEARTVVLRAFDPTKMQADLHTDLASDKITSLRASPRMALHIWEARARLQIRLSCTVDVLHGDEVADLWAKVPDPSRQSYGITPAPGTPIADALDYDKAPDPATFAVLRAKIVFCDLLHLGDDHRRARYMREDGWTGQWLAP